MDLGSFHKKKSDAPAKAIIKFIKRRDAGKVNCTVGDELICTWIGINVDGLCFYYKKKTIAQF